MKSTPTNQIRRGEAEQSPFLRHSDMHLSPRLFVTLIFAIAATLPFIGCPSTGGTEKGGGTNVERVVRPEWVTTGLHPDFPDSTHISAYMAGEAGNPPPESVMKRRLLERLHVLSMPRLGEVTDIPMLICIEGGRWASEFHFDDLKIDYHKSTDGFVAASVAGVRRSDVVRAAEAALAKRTRATLAVRIEEWERTASSPWVLRDTAYEDMLERHRVLSSILDEVAIVALSMMSKPESELVDPKLVEAATAIARRADEFREYLGCRVLQGNSPSANLGEPIPSIEFQLIWQGKMASNLPVRPVLAGLRGEMGRTSDQNGVVRIDFAEPARFTGQPSSMVGFELDWDVLSLATETGLRTPSWSTQVVLPSAENTVIYLNVTEKIGGRIIEGPIKAGLIELLRAAGMPYTVTPPTDAEARFVLEIVGVISCDEMEASRVSAIRQLRSKGALTLQSKKGRRLASIPSVEGVATMTVIDDPPGLPPPSPTSAPASPESKPGETPTSTPATPRPPAMTKAEREAKAKADAEAKAKAEEVRKQREAEFDRAGRLALEDAWLVWRSNIAREFRTAFPPIFRMAAER